jgi:GT2 family glycosyltransferase
MLASVILCTLRRAAQIGATLDSLLALPRPPGMELELVVVENGPPDGTRTEVERRAAAAVGWTLRYLHVEQKGKSRALNAGLAAARGELLFFVDDDLRFSPRWLTDLVALILSGRADGATSPITIPAHLRRPWMTPYHLGWLGCIRYRNQAQPDEMPGANMALHRRAVDRVPAFDLELGGGGLGNCEDTLFSRQVVAAGFRLAFAPEAPVEHHFEPAKLRYAQWQANAAAAGRSRAYLHRLASSPAPRQARAPAEFRPLPLPGNRRHSPVGTELPHGPRLPGAVCRGVGEAPPVRPPRAAEVGSPGPALT